MGHAIHDALGRPAWREIDARWVRGEITTSRRAHDQFALIDASQAEFEALVARHRIDPAFPPLVDDLRSQGAEVEIVSDGFDFYVSRMLAAAGLTDLPFTANQLGFRNGEIVLEFPHERTNGPTGAGWKAGHVRRAKARGRRVAYVGDGFSDLQAAPLADLLFAKSHLATHCDAHGIAYHSFSTLADVRTWVRGNLRELAVRAAVDSDA